MKAKRNWIMLPAVLLVCAAANCVMLVWDHPALIPLFALCGITGNLLPLLISPGNCGKKLRILAHGNGCLRVFCCATGFSVISHLITAVFFFSSQWLVSVLVCICVLALTFWNGMICVYCTSVQLGIKLRIIGALCGMIPIVNLIALQKILKTTSEEVQFETEKAVLDHQRHAQQICKTKYPILLVHGVFFRDSRFFNYWGRIPEALNKNGGEVFYGNQPSAASISACAEVLAERIQEVLQQTGSEKVNIIAHSKGGLDCRYAMAFCDAAPYVASLTTINTPHRGCKFADYLLNMIPQSAQDNVAKAYNSTLQKLGEHDADFIAAVQDLTSSHCAELDQTMPLPEDVFCHSIGSKLNRASGGKFPLNFTYHLVRHFDGDNDGLVGEESFQWGSKYTYLQTGWLQGISHGDMIDLNRYNIPGFDVREFYVQLVSDLRQRGF